MKSTETALAIVLVIAAVASYQHLSRIFVSPQQPSHLADFATFNTALHVFRQEIGRFPSSAEGLRALAERPPGIAPEDYRPTLRGELLDPWGNRYHYRYPPIHNDTSPDIWSSGQDGIPNTRDDLVNWKDPS